jgi:hypothetical protein
MEPKGCFALAAIALVIALGFCACGSHSRTLFRTAFDGGSGAPADVSQPADGQNGADAHAPGAGDGQESAAITKGTFRLAPQGGLGVEPFDMSVAELADGDVELRIDAVNARELPYALFNLEYDAAKYAPVSIDYGEFFGADVLTAGITTQPGNVGIGVVPIRYDEKPGVSGSGRIASVRFDLATGRRISVEQPPSSDPQGDVFMLTGTGGTGNEYTGATWPMVLIGDGDVSGEVTVADITPIAQHYLELTVENPSVDVVDYDGNGEIGIPDITPIANNYLMRIDGYHVYHDTVDEFNMGTAVLDNSVPFAKMIAAPAYSENGFLEFSTTFADLPPTLTTWYFFAVPFSYDTVNQPIDFDISYASEGFQVDGPIDWGGGRLDAYTIRISGLDTDQTFLSSSVPYDLTLTANESYTFEIVSVEVAFWNMETAQYDPAVTIDDTNAEWDTSWEVNIAWSTDAAADAFSFDKPTGSGAIGTCGPDDPYTLQITSFLNAATLEKTVTLNVTLEPDPEAPIVHAYAIRITGLKLDQAFISSIEPYNLTFTENEAYTFEIESAEVAIWNDIEMAYDPPITIDHTHPEWRTSWDTNIQWSTDASTDVFSFDVTEGTGAIGICGPYNPNEFQMTSFLNAATVEKAVTLNVTLNSDIKGPLMHDYTIQITGPNLDQTFLSSYEDYNIALTANESYTFEIVSANVALWNDIEQAFDPPITIDHTHPEWRTSWDRNIKWSTNASQDTFSFDVPEGTGAIGTCGPYNPNEFEITSFLNAASIGKMVILNATMSIDP